MDAKEATTRRCGVSLSSDDNRQINEHGRQKEKDSLTLWKLVLGLAALLDFLSTIMNRRLVQKRMSELSSTPAEESVFAHLRLFSQDYTLPHQVIAQFLIWLNDYSLFFGFLFSLLWSIRAFVEAQRNADGDLVEWDRRRLMTSLRTVLGRDGKKHVKDDNLSSTECLARFKTWLVYYGTLALQLFCLPVGFYMVLYQFILFVTNPKGKATKNPEELTALLYSTYESVDLPREYRTFSNETKLSLGFAIAKHTGVTFYTAAHLGAKKALWKEGRRLGLKAVINPLKYWKKAQKVLAWIRWIKYLQPLVGACVKLQNNLRGLVKVYNQRRQRKLAEKVRRLFWANMSGRELRVEAAKRIQSAYRCHRERQACWELMLHHWEKDNLAAARIQAALRGWLRRVRARLKRKRTELKKLESLKYPTSGRRKIKKGTSLSVIEEKRLTELKRELKPKESERRSINQRLLLRPNTKFQVIWKALFVFCVLMEIVGRLLSPRLSKQKDKVTGQPLTVSKKLGQMLLPVPVTKLNHCSCTLKVLKKGLGLWETWKDWAWACRPSPWFCGPLYYSFQLLYSSLVHIMINRSLQIMGLVALMDVPVFFFTGKNDPIDGMLVPKPFFARWIAPGLLLQVLINPEMEPASNFLRKRLDTTMQIGPIRVWRWTRVLFYPVVSFLFDFAEVNMWMPLVAIVNRGSVNATTMATDVTLGLRRSHVNPKRPSILYSSPQARLRSPVYVSMGRSPRNYQVSSSSIGPRRLSFLRHQQWQQKQKLL